MQVLASELACPAKVRGKLSEVVELLEAGWGFARPRRTERLGRWLREVLPEPLLATEVETELNVESGYGPGGITVYTWRIAGLPELPVPEAPHGYFWSSRRTGNIEVGYYWPA